MENVTTNVKIVGELPFQRLVHFFLWNIDEKAEHDFNVVEEKYDPSTHKDVSFESGKETDTLKTVSGFVKFTYKGEAGSVSYNYRNHLKFDKKDLFDNAINGTYRLNIFSTTDLTMEYSSISIMVMEKLAMFFAENIRHFEGYIDLRNDDKIWYQKIDAEKFVKETQDSYTLFIDGKEVLFSHHWSEIEDMLYDFLISLSSYFEDYYDYLRYKESLSITGTQGGLYIDGLTIDYRPHIEVVVKYF